MPPNTTTCASKSSIKVYPLDSDARLRESYPGNTGAATVTAIPSTDYSVMCSQCFTSNGLNCPQEEYINNKKKLIPNATPEALKRKSPMQVYPLDTIPR